MHVNITSIFVCLQTLDRNTKLVAANGKQIDAMIVFSLSIKYMKDEAIKTIRQRTGDASYDAKDIQWVLTVPAIWSPGAKQFMREAACTVSASILFKRSHLVVIRSMTMSMRELGRGSNEEVIDLAGA